MTDKMKSRCIGVHIELLVLVLCIIIISSSFVAISTAETISVEDGVSLVNHMCPGNGIVPPKTTLELSKPLLSIIRGGNQQCLVENTTDLSIVPSKEVLEGGADHVTVECIDFGFRFFNVTNLTLKLIVFKDCNAPITEDAVRYINGNNQFIVYNFTKAPFPKFSLIFNHCYNLKVHNVSTFTSTRRESLTWPLAVVDILGVNLLGDSEVINLLPEEIETESTPMLMFLYYTDSDIAKENLKSNLTITNNAISDTSLLNQDYDGDAGIFEKLQDSPEQMMFAMYSDFALYLMQQTFDVDVTLNVSPLWKSSPHPSSILIMFINSVTASRVILQGFGTTNGMCHQENPPSPTTGAFVLSVIFYETSSFQTDETDILTPMFIQNISFVNTIFGLSHYYTAILQVRKFTRKLSHLVVLKNVSWCKNDLADSKSLVSYSANPFYAENIPKDDSDNGYLSLNFTNMIMHHNLFSWDKTFMRKSSNCLVCFVNVDKILIGGTSYFGENAGGTVIRVKSSSLTISGNVTIKDGYAIEGGGIHLDGYSSLYLAEPLNASFINNRANRGSAIFAPPAYDNDTWSGIQISPSKPYSLSNVSGIDIKLHLRNNIEGRGVQRSLYAPMFSFFGYQNSNYILFTRSTWNPVQMEFGYTTIIDILLNDVEEIDKFTSLSNGICIKSSNSSLRSGLVKCQYMDYLYANATQQYLCLKKTLFNLSVYPGATAISIINVSNNKYIYELGQCQHFGEAKSRYSLYNGSEAVQTGNDILFVYKWLDLESTTLPVITSLTDTELDQLPFSLAQVSFNACPVGFYLNKGVCNCTVILEKHGYLCDISGLNFTSPKGYWTAVFPRENNETAIFINEYCPPNYCMQEMKSFTLNHSLKYTSCEGNRAGILCGECRQGFSAIFGSDTCHKKCTYLHLFTILVYILAGVLLVLVLFWLRLTVASGIINGLIFYASLLGLVMDQMTGDYSESQPLKIAFDIVYVVIAILNLNLGFPLCSYKGMTFAAKIGFQFLFPVYLWCMVALLIVISRYSVKVSKLIANNSVQVLSTLFYLSFSKLLTTVIIIFSPSSVTEIFSNETHNETTERLVWFYNGMGYGHGVHGFLLFLAILFTIFYLVPFAVFSTFSFVFMRFRFVNKVRPFVDAYSGPFKTKWRFWFGLRLWVMIFLFSVNGALEGTNTGTTLAVHIITVLVFILLQALACPFKNKVVGLIDVFFMLNYWIIIEVYYLFRSIFYPVYAFLTLAAMAVLSLIILYQAFESRIQRHGRHIILAVWHIFHPVIEDTDDNREVEEDSDDELYKAIEDRKIDTY